MNVQDHSVAHRTLCVIDFTDATPKFIERANRLNESVNGENIKVDFVSIVNGKPVSGFVTPGESYEADLSDDDIRAWASEQGYDQVLINRPG